MTSNNHLENSPGRTMISLCQYSQMKHHKLQIIEEEKKKDW